MTVERDRNAADGGAKDAAVARVRLPPIGFWSYSRHDDELSKGKLSNLRSLLMSEIQQQYGRERVQLFQDVSAIPHGAAWEREITRSLNNSTFFIPIITPNFVQSEWCCTEVRIFLEREQKLLSNYPDLQGRSCIFPLQLIDITGIDAHDQSVLTALEQLQWFDFRRMRHRNLDDESVQHALSEFAASIRDLLQLKVRRPLTAEERKRQAAEAEATRAREEAERIRLDAEERAAEAARVKAGLAAEARRSEEARKRARLEAARERREAEERAGRESLEADRRTEYARQAETVAVAGAERGREADEGAEPARNFWQSFVADRSRLWLLAAAAVPLATVTLASFLGDAGAPEARPPSDTRQDREPTNSAIIPAPSAAPSYPPGAVAMQDTLAAAAASEWASVEHEGFFAIERRVHALGSLSDLRILAQSGNPRAQYLIARALEFGQFGATQNRTEAFEWYHRAAESGDPRSQFDLGSAYEIGADVGQNYSEATRLYAAAAAQGFSHAQNSLGVCYIHGRGVERDYARAMSLLRQAADQNRRSAFSNIAYLYENGLGVEQDYAQAAGWARSGANLGDPSGQTRLGIFLYEGRQGVPQNQTEGLMWLRRAAAANYDFARSYLSARNLAL